MAGLRLRKEGAHSLECAGYVLKSSFGNDSVALIQWAHEAGLENVTTLYNDTGWARDDWAERVARLEAWARTLGFHTAHTSSIGMLQLVQDHRGWPRQGMQFCTEDLKIAPTLAWLEEHDPEKATVQVIGVRREESPRRRAFPERSMGSDGRHVWAPLVEHTEADRDALLARAGVEPLPHRSMECFPCVNANRADILQLAEDPGRIETIAAKESELGFTKTGKPRTMFRPYHYMGATGIREIVRWAKSPRGKFNLDDGNGAPGCEAGYCGG